MLNMDTSNPFTKFNTLRYVQKNSAVCVRTPTVNVNTFSTTVKDEILEEW